MRFGIFGNVKICGLIVSLKCENIWVKVLSVCVFVVKFCWVKNVFSLVNLLNLKKLNKLFYILEFGCFFISILLL